MGNHLKKTLSISIVASILLSNQALANPTLPNGGKFVNSGGGSINTCATNPSKCMNISGNDKNNVIAWGGGFNIGDGHTVNFTTSGRNYLNLDFTKKASQLLGTLNGGSNNIFLVNPSGVLVGKNGVINANKFVASTNPMNDTEIKAFAENGKFSSKISSKGDIVNLGTINANEVGLYGNKVENLSGTIQGVNGKVEGLGNQKYSNNIIIKGNNVYLNGDNLTGKSINAEVGKSGSFTQGTADYRNKHNITGGFTYSFSGNGLNNFQKFGYISTANDWKNFADNWNEDLGQFQDIFDEFRLTNNIDMKNMLVNPVGTKEQKFSKNFNGMGYTLSNVLINANVEYAGLFGWTYGSFKDYIYYIPPIIGNVTINGLNFQYSSTLPTNIGAFIGYAQQGVNSSNVVLKNIGDLKAKQYAGGFMGNSGGESIFSHISIDGIKSIVATDDNSVVGGFAGRIGTSSLTASNIAINNIKYLEGSRVGGFAGYISYLEGGVSFENIFLNFDNLTMKGDTLGAFTGTIDIKNNTSSSWLKNIKMVYKNLTTEDNQQFHTFSGDGISDDAIKNAKFYFGTINNADVVDNNNIKGGLPSNYTDIVSGDIFYKDGIFQADLAKNPYPTTKINEPSKKGQLESSFILGKDDFATEIVNDIFKEIVDSEYKIELKDKNKVIVSYKGNTYTIDLKDKDNPIAQALSFVLELSKNNKEILNEDITAFVTNYPKAKEKFEQALARINSDKFNELVKLINEIIISDDALNRLVSQFESLKAQYDYKIYVYNEAVKKYNEAVEKDYPSDLINSLKLDYELAYKDIVNTEGSLKNLQTQINNKFASLSKDFDKMVGDKEAFKQALGNLKLNEKYDFGKFGSYDSKGGLTFSDYMPIASVDVPGNITYPEKPALEAGDEITDGNYPDIPTIPQIPGKPTDPNNPEVPEIPTVPEVPGGGGKPTDPNPILPDRPEIEKPCPSGNCNNGGENPETRPPMPPQIDYNVETKLDESKYQGDLEQGEDIVADGEYREGEYIDGKRKKTVCVVSSSARTHNPCLVN